MELMNTRPKLFIVRLLPVGVGCICVGALCWMIAFDATENRVSAGTFLAFVTFGLPMSLMAAIIFLVPSSLIWIVSFESLRAGLTREQTAATISSGITATVGVAAMMLLFHQLTDGGWRLVGLLAPASLLPLFLAMFWTWRLFCNEGPVQ
jgi:hypothetical protein